MQRLLLPAAAMLATACGLSAQFSLTTLNSGGNQGNVGGGIYFDLTVNTTITIDQIDWRCGANTAAGTGTIDVFLGPSTYVGNVTNPQAWTAVAQATGPVAPNAVTMGVLTQPLSLGPGTYGVALQSSGFSHGYTNGAGCTSTTIPGSCNNSVFSNNELTIRAGAAQNAFLAGNIFTPRIWNGTINYTLGGNPITVASWEPFGQGCYANYQSYYQVFPNPSGINIGTQGAGNPTSIRHTLTADGYQVTTGNNAIVQPVSQPFALPANLTNVNATAVLGGPLPFQIIHPATGGVGVASDLEICTAGYITPAPATQAADNNPNIGAFLSGAPRWCPLWKDIDPSVASAAFHVELDSVNGSLNVTWLRAVDTGATAATNENSFQVAYFPNGDVEYRYGSLSLLGGGGSPVLIGWNGAMGALDPGNIEITTAVPFIVELTDNDPLRLESDARPITGSTVNLISTGIPATSAGIGAIAIGFVPQTPGLDLSFASAPGCFLNLAPNVVFSTPMAAPMGMFPLPIPNNFALNGGSVYAQAINFAPGFNAGGFITSNGLRLALGSL